MTRGMNTPPAASETHQLSTLPAVVSVAEAAKALRTSTKCVYEMVARGDINAARIGKKGLIRIRRDDLLHLFDKVPDNT